MEMNEIVAAARETKEWKQFVVNVVYFKAQLDIIGKLLDTKKAEIKSSRMTDSSILLFGIRSSGNAIINLIGHDFVGECYVLGRAFLEKSINFCYLSICDLEEYYKHLDWSSQKILRSLYSKQRMYETLNVKIPMPDISVFAERNEVKQFMTKRGGEKHNWTEIPLHERIKIVKEKVPKFIGELFFVTYNLIYEDASEYVHGTFYGETFHTGILYGAKDPAVAYTYLMGLSSNLCFMLGLISNEVLRVVNVYVPIPDLIAESEANYAKRGDVLESKGNKEEPKQHE
jgi:hypothetical protein